MTRYHRVLEILDQAIGDPTINIGAHAPFCRGLSRSQFRAKAAYGKAQASLRHGSESNFVEALK